jgi:hypothetical protein
MVFFITAILLINWYLGFGSHGMVRVMAVFMGLDVLRANIKRILLTCIILPQKT